MLLLLSSSGAGLCRSFSCRVPRRLLALSCLAGTRLFDIPGYIDDDQSRAAVLEESGAQLPGVTRVQQMLPPMPFHQLGNENGDCTSGVGRAKLFDELEQGNVDAAERRIEKD